MSLFCAISKTLLATFSRRSAGIKQRPIRPRSYLPRHHLPSSETGKPSKKPYRPLHPPTIRRPLQAPCCLQRFTAVSPSRLPPEIANTTLVHQAFHGSTRVDPPHCIPGPITSAAEAGTSRVKMSINWVMTTPGADGFVKLPNERILYTSPPRVSLQISTPNTFPGAQPLSIKSDAGVVYITNQRIVYLPTAPTPELQSFSSPVLNLQDTFVRAPFFGANYWVALCKPVSGGGVPPAHSAVELKFTFREGGAFDYHTTFEQIKERLHQAYSVARESGQRGAGNIDLANVHLEQLPAYEPAREVEPENDGPTILSPIPTRPGRDSGVGGVRSSTERNSPKPETFSAPDEPPPGYEEAQAQAVGIDLDRRLREEAERQRDRDDDSNP